MKMKMITIMVTWFYGVARFGSSRARHAQEAAIASARAKREHAGVRVRETTDTSNTNSQYTTPQATGAQKHEREMS